MHIKKAVKTIDQTTLRLPPLWRRRKPVSLPRTETWNDAGLWQTGPSRSAASRAIRIIDNAREVIVACSFLLSDPEILGAVERASARGVRAYAMLAAENRLLSEPPEHDRTDLAEWKRRVLDEFRESLRRLGGRTLIRASDQFHAKVVIADPATRPAGMLFTANLTREALERNQELAVELSERQVREIMTLLGWGFWEASTHEIINPKQSGLSPIRPLQAVAHPEYVESFVCTTARSTSIRSALLAALRAEDRDIKVTSFGWSMDHEVIGTLVEKARAGVRVTIFARPRAAAMPALIALQEAGANVLGFEFLHAKAIWTSSGPAYVVSANLEPHGLDSGFELGVALGDRERDALGNVFAEWEQTAEWELLTQPSLGGVIGKVQIWRDRRLVDDEVVTTARLTAPRREIASAELLESAEPAAQREPLPLAHTVLVEGDIAAPTLHPKAKEVLREAGHEKDGPRREPYSPRVFTHSGRTFVVVRAPGEMAAATELRAQLKADAIVFDGAHP
jgi:cardiolipin synthase